MTQPTVTISRRAALLGAGAATLAAGSGLTLTSASAMTEMKGVAELPFARFKVGAFEVTTLLDGAVNGSEPQKTFGMNVDADTFATASAKNFIPADAFRAFFTPTLINTGKELVLFDTGSGSGAQPARGNIASAIESAGYTADQIDIVVLTHMHPDHIGGMMTGGAPTFPNARYVTGSVEYNFWSGMDPEANGVTKLVASGVTPMADKMTFIDDGGSVVSGITAMSAFGHTPGHMAYQIESDGQRLIVAADAANHYVWSLANPDWEVRFDADKAAAAATRRKLFGMIASEKVPFIGYHMPFPSLGYVEAMGDGFRYVPATYQLRL